MDANEIREILNGIWAVSAFCVLVLLVMFIAVYRIGKTGWGWRWKRPDWWHDSGVQLAMALWILVLGHFMRAFPQWIQFIILNEGPNFDTESKVYQFATAIFIPATILVVLGKILCVWSISPGESNYYYAGGVLTVSITVPLLVFWLY